MHTVGGPGTVLCAGSVPFSLEIDVAKGTAELRRWLSGFPRVDGGATGVVRYVATLAAPEVVGLTRDGARVAGVTSPASILDALLLDLAGCAVRSLPQGGIGVHAGVVSLRDRAVLLPGRAGASKSTLTCALVRAGCRYLSDEVALLEGPGSVVSPFPRPLLLDEAGIARIEGLADDLPPATGAVVAKRRLAPDDVRPGCVGAAAPVGMVVIPEVGSASSSLEPISRAEAGYVMAMNASPEARLSTGGLDTIAATVRDASCYRLRIGEVMRDASDLVLAAHAGVLSSG